MKDLFTEGYLDSLNSKLEDAGVTNPKQYVYPMYQRELIKTVCSRLREVIMALKSKDYALLDKFIGWNEEGNCAYISFKDCCGLNDLDDVRNELLRADAKITEVTL